MRTRVLSALVFVPAIIGLVLWTGGELPFSGWPFALAAGVLALLGLAEFYDGCRAAGYTPRDALGHAAGIYFVLAATPVLRGQQALSFGLTTLVLIGLIVETLRRDRAPLKSLPVTWLGALYVGWLLSFAVRLRLFSFHEAERMGWFVPSPLAAFGPGAWLLLFTMAVTSLTDTGAYLAGRSFGRHKMAPALSPGKTWEGAVGGLMVAVLAGWGAGFALGLPAGFSLTA